MINKEDAKILVEQELDNIHINNDELIIMDDLTIETSFGWFFFYQSKKYIETNDIRYMLGGNAPFMIDRKLNKLIYTGTSYDIEYYIKKYEQEIKYR